MNEETLWNIAWEKKIKEIRANMKEVAFNSLINTQKIHKEEQDIVYDKL